MQDAARNIQHVDQFRVAVDVNNVYRREEKKIDFLH